MFRTVLDLYSPRDDPDPEKIPTLKLSPNRPRNDPHFSSRRPRNDPQLILEMEWYSKTMLVFCHCRALFSSVLFLKIIVNNVLYCCTVNLSRHNYFLANKNLLFCRCLFVAKTIFYSLAALVRKILFCHSKIKFISSRHCVISSTYLNN